MRVILLVLGSLLAGTLVGCSSEDINQLAARDKDDQQGAEHGGGLEKESAVPVAPEQAGSFRKMLKQAHESKLYDGVFGQSPRKWVARAYLLQAISLDDPEYALVTLKKPPRDVTSHLFVPETNEQDEESILNYRVECAGLLSQTLKGKHLQELLEFCAKTGSNEIAWTAASSMQVEKPEDVKLALGLVNPNGLEGSLILLTHAIELKHRGLEWQEIASKAAYRQDPERDGPIARTISLMRIRLQGGEKEALRSWLSKLDFTKEGEGAIYPLRILFGRLPYGREAGELFAIDLIEASDKVDPRQAFRLCGLLASFFGHDAPPSLIRQIRAYARDYAVPEETPIESMIDYTAGFHIARVLIDNNDEAGVEMASSLANRLLGLETARSHYHMISTLSGIIARRAPEKALEIANKVRTLEWQVHAKRCVYRSWAKDDASKAAASLDAEESFAFNEAIRADLLLEVALGASLKDPIAAMELADQLPNQPAKYALGYCFIAPSLAEKDPDRAIKGLRSPKRGEFSADAALALAIIYRKIHGVESSMSKGLSQFYPDLMLPQDEWPGPHLSFPLRFVAEQK